MTETSGTFFEAPGQRGQEPPLEKIDKGDVAVSHLELLDVPGRWHRVDVFGRERVDLNGQQASLRPQLGVGGNA